MALIKLLASSTSVHNTGNTGGGALGIARMLFLLPPGFTIPVGTTNIVSYMTTAIHASKNARVYPIGGYAADFWDITGDAPSDITETSPLTGAVYFLQSGVANKVFVFQAQGAGAIFAQDLNSFRNSGFSFMLVDDKGNYALVENIDPTTLLTTSYSGMATVGMGGQSYQPATATSAAKIRFGLSYRSDSEINASLFTGGLGLLNLKGLTDIIVAAGTGPNTTTNIFVTLLTKLGIDVTGSTPAILAPANFVVTNHATGAPITITAVTAITGQARLTGTFVSGQSYDVALSPAATLFSTAPYFEGANTVTVVVP